MGGNTSRDRRGSDVSGPATGDIVFQGDSHAYKPLPSQPSSTSSSTSYQPSTKEWHQNLETVTEFRWADKETSTKKSDSVGGS